MIMPARDAAFGAADEPLLPVTALPSGAWGRVAALDDACDARAHLADLGVVAGVPLRVVRAHGSGPVLLQVKGSRLALGRGLAARILVHALAGAPADAGEATS